jgi:hypothetical protein
MGNFDDSLVYAYESVKKQGLTIHDFASIFGGVIAMVASHAAFNRVLRCKEKWSEVAEDLDMLCTESRLGSRCFSHARLFVVSATMEKVVCESLDSLVALKFISEAAYLKHIATCMSKVEQSTAAALGARRLLQLVYNGVPIQVQVANFQEEVAIRTATAVKSRLAGTPQLVRLPFDEILGHTEGLSCDEAISVEWQQVAFIKPAPPTPTTIPAPFTPPQPTSTPTTLSTWIQQPPHPHTLLNPTTCRLARPSGSS